MVMAAAPSLASPAAVLAVNASTCQPPNPTEEGVSMALSRRCCCAGWSAAPALAMMAEDRTRAGRRRGMKTPMVMKCGTGTSVTGATGACLDLADGVAGEG